MEIRRRDSSPHPISSEESPRQRVGRRKGVKVQGRTEPWTVDANTDCCGVETRVSRFSVHLSLLRLGELPWTLTRGHGLIVYPRRPLGLKTLPRSVPRDTGNLSGHPVPAETVLPPPEGRSLLPRSRESWASRPRGGVFRPTMGLGKCRTWTCQKGDGP